MKVKMLLIVVLSVFLSTASSFAIPIDQLNFGQDYWTCTDFTTGEDGNAYSFLKSEDTSYESAFGLYSFDENGAVETFFQIFGASAEAGTDQAVSFRNESGSWFATLDNPTAATPANWTAFDSKFGFYFDVFTEDTYNYTLYTDASLNIDSEEHIGTIYDNFQASVYLDDKVVGYNDVAQRDFDYNDMVVKVVDMAPAPVPEPATMFLLGAGILGLVGVRRKKKIK